MGQSWHKKKGLTMTPRRRFLQVRKPKGTKLSRRVAITSFLKKVELQVVWKKVPKRTVLHTKKQKLKLSVANLNQDWFKSSK